ncbi:hypothetical protein JXM67_10375 [candidate division WOR-3 bacterium]|nr:hypothetical protein [candidate division WOR-3 bacterium]
MNQDINSLAARIKRLEHQNRILKTIGSVLILVMAAFIVIGAVSGSNKQESVVEAEAFVLKDSEGVERGRFSVVNNTSDLTLNDPDGDWKLSLKVFGDGLPQVYVNTTVMGPGIVLDGNAPAIGFFGQDGRPIATIP